MRRAMLVLLAALALAGCGDSRPGAGAPPGSHPGYADLDPPAVARAYVEAIDRRQGDRWCRLVAPYISGRIDMLTGAPDSMFHMLGSCGKFVSTYIGYIEDCCPPEFKHARVLSLGPPHRTGDLVRVDARIQLDTITDQAPKRETLRDVIWLAKLDGAWRVAKVSAVARAASLGPFDEQGRDDDPLAPPNLAAEQQRYEAAVREYEKRLADHEESFSSRGEADGCGDGPRVGDPGGDLRNYPASAPDGPIPPAPQVDLRAMSVTVEDGRLCAEYEMAAEVRGPMQLRFDMGDLQYASGAPGVGYHRSFDMEIRADGQARITSGEDDDDRPIAREADISIAGNRVTVRFDPDELGPGVTRGTPPLDNFAFDGAAMMVLEPGRAVRDDLGPEAPSGYFRYPDGGPVATTPPGGYPPAGAPPAPGPPPRPPPTGP